jgi:uncharacterized membrane protein
MQTATLADLIGPLGPADLAAVAYLVLGWLLANRLIEHPPASRPSVDELMRAFRHEWMRQMVTRVPRIFDANIMDNLRQGTTFFASACMIAIGGGVALIGNTDRIAGVAEELPLDPAPAVVWQIKILFVVLFVTNGLLKFIWAHRLFGYCAIVMASVPNDPTDPEAHPRATQAAEINIAAARNFNRGLRAVYFALGALAWLIGAWALALATTATLWVILRREFASASRRALLLRPLPGRAGQQSAAEASVSLQEH